MTSDHPREQPPQLEVVEMVAQVVSQQLETWYAPMPRPEDYEHYERVHPGSADRILTMAEKEQDARLNAVPQIHTRRVIGLILSSLISLGALVDPKFAHIAWSLGCCRICNSQGTTSGNRSSPCWLRVSGAFGQPRIETLWSDFIKWSQWRSAEWDAWLTRRMSNPLSTL